MFNELLLLKKEKKSYFFSIILILFFPLSILLSSTFTNFSVVATCLIFLFLTFKEKDYYIFKDKFFILLLIFFIYILLNCFTSINFQNSFSRSVGFFRFIILPFALLFFIRKYNFRYAKLIFKFWTVIFIFISIDLIFEFFFGYNTFGYSNQFPGRLSSVLDDELKIGYYYFGFFLITLASISLIFKKNIYFTILSMIVFTIISLLIGERSNFLKLFTGLILFLCFWNEINFKIKLSVITLIIILISTVFTFNKDLNNRFKNQFAHYLLQNGLKNYYHISTYGAHYSAAIKIFKNYPIKGTGLKNFYFECIKNEYDDKKFLANNARCTTHPHQLHLEILSQLGLVGYLIFITLIFYFLYRSFLNYLKYKNSIHLSGFIFVFVSIFLPVPSGSFFTSFGATIFWINIGVTLAFEKVKQNQF